MAGDQPGTKDSDDAPRLLRAVDCALDFCKQQLSFAITLISLTITIMIGFSQSVQNWGSVLHSFILFSWSLLLASVAFGLLLLGRATEELRDIRQRNVSAVVERLRIFAFFQFILLSMGVLIMVSCVGIIMLS